MVELDKIILGIVLLTIGIVVLLKNKTLVKMAIESQKGVDRVIKKEQSYNRIGISLIPKIVILVIGVCFCIFGIIAILTNFFSLS